MVAARIGSLRWQPGLSTLGYTDPVMTRDNTQSHAAGMHLLEGFFGRTWPWSVRSDFAPFLQAVGFSSYIYAPKDDPYLRRQWQQAWPAATRDLVETLAHACHDAGLQFGVGLSPFEIYRQFGAGEQAQLASKIDELNKLPIDILCLLFDDMRGDMPGLAQTQIDIAHRVAGQTRASRVIMCPTYYSTDPLLEQVFGERPVDYWPVLATQLDRSIDLFWTGPQVCSTHYEMSHLHEVAERLGRQPVIWDNYPVNDGAKTSRFLNIRAFDHRQAIRAGARGHAINPMNQPWLSRIALRTAKPADVVPAANDVHQAFRDACVAECGDNMGQALIRDVGLLQDIGLDGMSREDKLRLRQEYTGYLDDAGTRPYAQELLDWLDEQYAFDPACLTG